jgi:tRNA(Arg) A34 adenosine deaminase TadA
MNNTDVKHLEHCLRLARNAVDRGDEPFGSILVSADGMVLSERENRVNTSNDVTAHPEIELARWASQQMSPEERAAATMYTSGEHCPMCSAAHALAGIGRLVYALSAEQIRKAAPAGSVTFRLPASEVIGASSANVDIDGPCDELKDDALALFDLMRDE